VKRLLEQKADPNGVTRYPTAGPIGHVRINPAPVGSSPVHIAAASGNADLVKLLLDHGGDANLLRPDGHAPLSIATKADDLEVVKVLVAHGADLKRTYDPSDPIVNLEKGPDGSSKSEPRHRQTLLHIAAIAESYRTIPFLAANGVPLNEKNERGETPLMLAEAQEEIRYMRDKANAQVNRQVGLGGPDPGTVVKRTQASDALRRLASSAPTGHSIWDRAIRVQPFDLPRSDLLGEESLAAADRMERRAHDETLAGYTGDCFDPMALESEAVRSRCTQAAQRFSGEFLDRLKARYRVVVEPGITGSVATTTIMPADGVSHANRHRVLINVPGPDITAGDRGQIESIAISALGRIKVVSVNYKNVPAGAFPAARAGVPEVYAALLKEYRPEAIGIFGCAGGALEELGWLQGQGLPMPGAVAVLSAPPTREAAGGDSARLFAAITGNAVRASTRDDAQGLSAEQMAKFPPTLLLAATRDVFLSPIVAAHARLVALQVPADLHVWEGLGHAFFFDPDFPESREAYDVIVRFFTARLGDGNRGDR
jgi:acetyl esterase/lipase